MGSYLRAIWSIYSLFSHPTDHHNIFSLSQTLKMNYIKTNEFKDIFNDYICLGNWKLCFCQLEIKCIAHLLLQAPHANRTAFEHWPLSPSSIILFEVYFRRETNPSNINGSDQIIAYIVVKFHISDGIMLPSRQYFYDYMFSKNRDPIRIYTLWEYSLIHYSTIPR